MSIEEDLEKAGQVVDICVKWGLPKTTPITFTMYALKSLDGANLLTADFQSIEVMFTGLELYDKIRTAYEAGEDAETSLRLIVASYFLKWRDTPTTFAFILAGVTHYLFIDTPVYDWCVSAGIGILHEIEETLGSEFVAEMESDIDKLFPDN